MSNEFPDLKDELIQMELDNNLKKRVDCSSEDNKKLVAHLKKGFTLPTGFYQYTNSSTGEHLNEFYTIADSGLTEDEKRKYMEFKKISYINTIKKCIVFFTVIEVINILAIVVLLALFFNGKLI